MKSERKKKMVKLDGGRHAVYLDTAKNRVKKKFVGDMKWTRLLQDFHFNKYNPFSPSMLKISKEFKYFYQQYIQDSREPTLQELVENGLTKRIARCLSATHHKKIIESVKEDHKKMEDENVNYVAVSKKYLEFIKDKKFVMEVSRQTREFNVLNEEEDFALIHGDLAFHNILIRKLFFFEDIYFIDAEAELVKTKRSIGNKYIDLSFFIAHNLLMKSYSSRLNGIVINQDNIEQAIKNFLDVYFHHNGISQKKLVRAMALYFLRKAKEDETRITKAPTLYLLNELNKEMCLICLKHQRLDKVLKCFFEKYNEVKEVKF